jgi:hypothetical protein
MVKTDQLDNNQMIKSFNIFWVLWAADASGSNRCSKRALFRPA